MSETRDITLQWKDPNIIEKGYKVYRSKEPMDINNMPEAIASLEKNSTEYIDKDQTIGDTNYYRVSAWIEGHEVFSKEVEIEIYSGDVPNILKDSTEIAFYRFDNNLNDYYGKWNAFSVGSIEYQTGVFSYSVNTDGGAIGISPEIFNDTNNQFSISSWLKVGNIENETQILRKSLVGMATNRFNLGIRNNNIMRFHLSSSNTGSGSDFFANVPDFNYDNWNHFVLVYDGSGFNIYIDSKFQSRTSRNLNITSTTYDLVIGGTSTSSGRISANSGDINFDNLRIFNRALNSSDVEILYQRESI